MCRKQKNLTLEKAIIKFHTGELREAALKLVAYLNKNNLVPLKVSEPNTWKIPFEGKCICGIWCREQHFDVHFWHGDFSGAFDEESASAIQQHIACCYNCHDGCTGGLDTSVFGKEITNVCSQHTVQFNNPAESDLMHIMNILEYSKKYMLNSESYHANHF